MRFSFYVPAIVFDPAMIVHSIIRKLHLQLDLRNASNAFPLQRNSSFILVIYNDVKPSAMNIKYQTI